MVLRLLAYNSEHWLAGHLNAYLRDNDEYRAITRETILRGLSGTITYTPDTITVHLNPPDSPQDRPSPHPAPPRDQQHPTPPTRRPPTHHLHPHRPLRVFAFSPGETEQLKGVARVVTQVVDGPDGVGPARDAGQADGLTTG